jgi:RimJ/RimL family protein N-acetyltransferase
VGRARRKLAQEGLGATLRHAGHLLARRVYLQEDHVWYRLDLTARNSNLKLPSGVEVRRASPEEVDRVAELGQDLADAHAHHEAGHELWLTHEGDAVLFACWIFRDSAPVMAAPGGILELAQDTVCLEDSFTSERSRGRGIAPASWSQIARRLAVGSVKTIITKVETDNVPSKRAVRKAGFRPIGVMHLTKLAGHKHTVLEPAGEGPAADLAERLRDGYVDDEPGHSD